MAKNFSDYEAVISDKVLSTSPVADQTGIISYSSAPTGYEITYTVSSDASTCAVVIKSGGVVQSSSIWIEADLITMLCSEAP